MIFLKVKNRAISPIKFYSSYSHHLQLYIRRSEECCRQTAMTPGEEKEGKTHPQTKRHLLQLRYTLSC